MIPQKEEPYGFAIGFERAVVVLACLNSRFFGRVGMNIDPELLKRDEAKLAMKACRAIYKELGHGPDSGLIVLQRLKRWMDDGKVTFEQIQKVSQLFDDAEDAGLPNPDTVIGELAPVLQLRMRDKAVKTAIHNFAQQGDLSKVVAMEAEASRIGQADTSVGTVLGAESWIEVSSLKDLERLRTGIPELDSHLDGGLQRGGLGVLLADSGGGKSIGLNHISGVSVLDGLFVAYATLELPRPTVLARTKASMTNIPINALASGDVAAAKKILDGLSHKLGHFVVQDFTPYATTVEDLFEWVDRCQDFAGHEVDVLVVDYGDKLGAKKTKTDESGYTQGRVVFEGLRIWAHDNKKFCWTASQATRRKDQKKRLDLNDCADSMHKIRVADLVVTLNVKDEGDLQTIELFIAKHRTGPSKISVGPFPTAFEVGQLCAT